MRQPSHVILDFYTKPFGIEHSYWAYKFVDRVRRVPYIKSNNRVIINRIEYIGADWVMFSFHTSYVQLGELVLPTLRITNYGSTFYWFKHNIWYNLLNIHFLRKESLYTKLKYSRSPAYDIVSGGAAALLAGLLGFLISEKFGIELVDSGDFYYLWMYLVFISFAICPLLAVVEPSKSLSNVFSLRRVLRFYISVIINTLKMFK